MQSGASIATGSSPGCISTGGLSLNGTFQAQIGGTTACSGYDQVQASGAVSVSGSSLQLSLINGFKPAVGNSFTIIDNTGGNGVTGTFSNLSSQGSTITVGGYIFKVSYTGNGDNSIVLTVVSPASGSAAGSSSSTKIAPKSPDAGLGSIAANPLTTLLASAITTVSIVLISRRLQQRHAN